jgi:hypothetical protein
MSVIGKMAPATAGGGGKRGTSYQQKGIFLFYFLNSFVPARIDTLSLLSLLLKEQYSTKVRDLLYVKRGQCPKVNIFTRIEEPLMRIIKVDI